jgi:tripartite ATP-independent transporter DctP family solute receptor
MGLTRRQLVGAAAASTLITRPSRAQAEFEFKIGFDVPDTHPLSLRTVEAAKAIAEQTAGRLQLKVFPNSLLGGDTEMLSQVRSGGLELFGAPSLTLSTLVPLSGLPSVGFGFTSYDHVWAAMDGNLGSLIRAAIGKAGLVPMTTVWDNGFRQITSARGPVNTPADLAGFKIRVPNTALLTSLFSSLGASPTSINFNELYSALQTNVVEGQENPLALIDTSKLYEVQKYCTLSNHCWSGYWMVANRRALARLPDDVREVLERNLNAAALNERADLMQADDAVRTLLIGKGLLFNKPDPAPFQAALKKAGFYAKWQGIYGAEPWQTLESYTGALT